MEESNKKVESNNRNPEVSEGRREPQEGLEAYDRIEAEEKIDEILATVLDEDKRKQLSEYLSVTIQKVRSGPLPPPSEMEAFGRIDPSLPGRIMEMAEKEQALRHKITSEEMQFHKDGQQAQFEMSKSAQNAYNRDSFIGLIFAFILLGSVIIGGFTLIALDYTITGSIFSGAGVVAAITNFFLRRPNSQDEKDQGEKSAT